MYIINYLFLIEFKNEILLTLIIAMSVLINFLNFETGSITQYYMSEIHATNIIEIQDFTFNHIRNKTICDAAISHINKLMDVYLHLIYASSEEIKSIAINYIISLRNTLQSDRFKKDHISEPVVLFCNKMLNTV